jgi:hypothetical protein
MSGFHLFDVVIGMVFIYLLLSLICSAANEIIEGWLKNRATDLERGIREMLEPNSGVKGEGIVSRLYNHPLINGLYKGNYDKYVRHMNRFFLWRWIVHLFNGPNLPAYIPARNFALALMDTVLTANVPSAPATGQLVSVPTNTPSGTASVTSPATSIALPPLPIATTPLAPAALMPPGTPNALQHLRDMIGNENDEQMKKALLALFDAAENDADKARENIEDWFNSSMDRVSGWYKRRAQFIIFLLGSWITIALNADSITLLRSLFTDKALRDSLVVTTEVYAKTNNPAPQLNASPSPLPPPSPSSSLVVLPSPSLTKGDAAASSAARPSASPSQTPLSECVKDENSPECKLAKNREEIKKLGLPVGWVDSGDDPKRKWPGTHWKGEAGWWDQLYWHWLGWLITTLAITLGAPFWFDLLNKFIIVRSTIKPKEKSPEERSKQ